jgi:hypothetical protein
MVIILVKKLQKTLCWMVKWITIVYVLVVCAQVQCESGEAFVLLE